MIIKNAKFITSVAEVENLKSDLPEFAFAGKSNCGKSSLINFLTNNGKLAITSSLPGRTRLINYFLINNDMYFVDLPGYGFAKASKEVQNKFSGLIEKYLETSTTLKHLFILVDIRNGANLNDKQLLMYCYSKQIPFSIIATKGDKLSRAQLGLAKIELASNLGIGVDNIVASSSTKKMGKEEILKILEERLKF